MKPAPAALPYMKKITKVREGHRLYLKKSTPI
jgi:hypothetical protein